MDGFGNRLKLAREAKGFNQKQFADKIGITAARLSAYEKDKREPDFFMFKKIVSALSADANELLGIDVVALSNDTDEGLLLYEQLDLEDKAEIRGEMKQMLKSPKYNNTSISAEIAADITKLMNMPTRTKSR